MPPRKKEPPKPARKSTAARSKRQADTLDLPERLSQASGPELTGAVVSRGSLARLLIDAAAQQGNRGILFVQDDESEVRLTYTELLQRSRRRLAALRAEGLSAGGNALLMIHRGVDFIETFWACMLGGIVAVPLTYPGSLSQPGNTLSKMHGVWEQMGRPLLLADRKFTSALEKVGSLIDVSEMRVLAAEDLEASDEGLEYSYGENEELCFIQYSSGSTGSPKGVALTHRNLLANVEAMLTHTQVTDEDRYCSWMPYSHDMGLIGLHMPPMAAGIDQINIPALKFAQKPLLWLEKISQHRATITGSPNFGYRLVLDRIDEEHFQKLDLSCLRIIYNGAEPIAVPNMREFMQTLARAKLPGNAMYPVYGMAEASVALCFPPVGEIPIVRAVERHALAAAGQVEALGEGGQTLLIVDEGSPIPGSEIRVVDNDGQLLPEGRVGHIQIRGENVTRGYYNNPQANADLFDNGWLRTGDLGFMLAGRISITGRAKDIVIVNGQKFFAYDLEQRAEEVEGVRAGKVIACGWHEPSLGRELVVMFVGTQHVAGSKKTTREVLADVSHHVGAVFGIAIDYLVHVKNVPRTTSGKLQRYQMLAGFREGKFAESTFAASELFDVEIAEAADPLVHTAPAPTPVQAAPAPKPKATTLPGDTLARVRAVWSRTLKRDEAQLPADRSFQSLGGTSLKAVQMLGMLEEAFDTRLSHELLLDCRTIGEMAAYIDRHLGHVAPQPEQAVAAQRAVSEEDIAIIGMACRFPGANDADTFWRNLVAGHDAVSEVPPERWNAERHYTAGEPQAGQTNSRWGGFINGAYEFDAGFFHLSEEEAAIMDPQQRLFLQSSWQALEHAGYSGERSEGHAVGVFCGASHNNYAEHHQHAMDLARLQQFESFAGLPAHQQQAFVREWKARFGDAELQPNTAVDNLLNMIAARTSHLLNLKGPSLTIDTACSSSLVAVHLACDSLRKGECELAIAGGVNLNLTPTPYLLFARAGALSPTGRCRVFDAEADGFVPGEGVGTVILKPLSRAIADGDSVLAVIKKTAVNNDGRSIGPMAPNPDGQRLAIAAAYRDGALDPRELQYLEAHGTGTAIGDPSEIRALTAAFEQLAQERGVETGHCVIGSVKANIGHLLSAAGVASLIKLIQALRHKQMPPSLHLRTPNPHIGFANTPFSLITAAQAWDAPASGTRRGAINSFGFGGTNCHLVLEEAPQLATLAPQSPRPHLISLSAPTREGLLRRSQELAAHLLHAPETSLADVSYTLHTGRKHFAERLAVVADSAEALAEKLLQSGNAAQTVRKEPALALMFTGQGAQYPNMGRHLYEQLPAFRRVLEEVAVAFEPHLDKPLLELIFGGADEATLAQTRYTQPLMFALDYSLARLLLDWGLKPAALMGHSVGEYAAATLAGVMSLDDAAKLIATRGRLIGALPAGGGMLAVFMSEAELRPLLSAYEGHAWFGAHNGTHQVVSGELAALDALQAQLQSLGKTTRKLAVSHAFHTPLMQPMLAEFDGVLAQVKFNAPRIPLVSNLDADWIIDRVPDAAYWREHILAPVAFEQSLRTLTARSITLLLECGPDKTLSNLARATLAGTEAQALPTLDRKRGDWDSLLSTLGALYQQGVTLDWNRIHADDGARRIVLPGYPFERKEHRIHTSDSGRIIDVQAAAAAAITSRPSAGASNTAAPAPVPAAAHQDWQDVVQTYVAEALNIAPQDVDLHRNFNDLGMTSAMSVALAERIGRLAQTALPPTLVFEHQSPGALAEYLRRNLAAPESEEPRHAAPVMRAALHFESSAPLAAPAWSQLREHDIAIVGMACRLPGADTPDELWQRLMEGRTQIREIAPERWSAEDYFDADPKQAHASYSKWAAILDKPYDFDPMFFGISPREAAVMDPQQRLFMEVAWEALQQSGYGGDFRTREIGIFVGCEQNHYGEHFITNHRYEALRRRVTNAPWFATLPEAARDNLLAQIADVLKPAELIPDAVAGQGLNEIAARINHWLDLRGPSLMVNTACSSSLVALHLACESLRSGESRIAIAGGAYLTGNDTPFVFLSRVGALSATGQCLPFDARANGMVLGEGISAVVLKPLRDAVRDGDHIHAVIKGSAINNDGHSNGITAPNPRGQADAIRKAYINAGVSPESIDYIECHGTGTPLGDPVEIEGMTQAFRRFTERESFCGVGSLKSLLGHMLSGSSLPSLMKVVLSLQHSQIPPTAAFESPNPHIDFARSPFYLVAGEAKAWKHDAQRPRRAGINSFGFGGTNCHVVLEEAPQLEPSAVAHHEPQLLLLTGRTQAVLQKVAQRLDDHLAQHPQIDAAQVCLTMNGGQRDLPFKAATLVRDRHELRAVLAAIAGGQAAPQIEQGRSNPKQSPRLYLALDGVCGMSAQEVDALIARFPQLQQLCDECKEHYASAIAQSNALSQYHLDDLLYAFAVQYALGRLLMSTEVEPAAIVAEGTGVLAGACLLGMISIKQAAEMLSRYALGHREMFATPEDHGERGESWHCPLIIPGAVLHRRQEDAVVRLAGYLQLPQALQARDLREQLKPDAVVAHFGGSPELRRQFEQAQTNTRWIDLSGSDEVIARLLRAFGRLYVAGVRFNSRPLALSGSRRVPLPTYPFENQEYRYAVPSHLAKAGVAVATAAPPAVAAVAPAPARIATTPAATPTAASPQRITATALSAAQRASLAAALRGELQTLKT